MATKTAPSPDHDKEPHPVTQLPNLYLNSPNPSTDSESEKEKLKFPSDPAIGIDAELGQTRATLLVDESSSDSSSEKAVVTGTGVINDYLQLVTQVISTEDDPSLSPWTFRMWFIGIGLSTFGGVLAEIYYFKPQTIGVSTMFLAIISYVIGEAMAHLIPRSGVFRYLNPGPFNKKEHVAIVIMAGAAASSALGTEILAVQRLYYNETPNAVLSIFMLFSSQLLGYGMVGFLRPILVYPTRMLYPSLLPIISMFDTLHGEKRQVYSKLKLFWIAFFCIFLYEIFPQWIFPLLTGFSVFCLANPTSPTFTMIFGGSNGDEGLGIGSIGLDWQYIGSGALAVPLQSQVSAFIGYILCIAVFCGLWWGNIWQAQNFPFLSQTLFFENGTLYDQLLILDDNLQVDFNKLAEVGLPWYSSTYVVSVLVTNMAFAATFVHLLLWNRNDMAAAWTWAAPSNLLHTFRTFNWRFWQDNGELSAPENDADLDPHYKQMLKYKEVPNWWYTVILVLSTVVGLVVSYEANSTLPWWSFFIGLALAFWCLLFLGAFGAITGLSTDIGTVLQMIGAYLNPGKPVANMYFVLWSANSAAQGSFLLGDLKMAQYVKLPPRCAFTVQIVGTVLGALLNWIIMNSIVENQRDILLSVEGTNVWSGQAPQSYNSDAIAWGGLGHQLFDIGGTYQWVPLAFLLGLIAPIPFWIAHKYWPKLKLDYFYTPAIISYISFLFVGINSTVLSYFAIALWSQWYLRKKHPEWFRKYNYVLAAALDGGAAVMVFILTFAVQGASGQANLFPQWWGANQEGNYDRCFYPY